MDRVGPIEMDRGPGDRQRSGAGDVSDARRVLREARSELDSAVARMPDVEGEKALATPELLVLLAVAVDARKRLDVLEALQVPIYELK